MRRTCSILALLLTPLLLAGCGGDDNDGPGGGGGLASDADFTIEAALGELPRIETDDDQPALLVVGDLDRASELAGLTRPEGDEVTDWLLALTNDTLAVPLPENLKAQYAATNAYRDLLGFDVRDVSTFASLETAPRTFTALRLDDDAQLKAGLTSTGDGEPGDMDRTGMADGSPFAIVLGVEEQDGVVALGQQQALLDAWQDGSGSMADDAALVSVARALDQHEVYGASLLDGDSGGEVSGAVAEPDGQEPVPDYDAVAVGEAFEDGTAVTYVAYRFADDSSDPESAIEAIWTDGTSVVDGRPIADLVTVDEVTTQSGVVVLRLVPERAGTVQRMLRQRESPFATAS